MPPQYARFATLLPYLQQVADPPVSGNPPATPAADPPKADGNEPLGEAGKKALDDERQARRDAEKRARDAQKELDDLKAAKVKADEEEQAEQGRWKELAEKREASLTETTTERDSLKTRVETLEKLASDRLTALLADIPKEIAELGPDESTPIEKRLEWAEKAAKAAGVTAPKSPGNGPNPPPANGHFDRDAATAKAKATGKYTI